MDDAVTSHDRTPEDLIALLTAVHIEGAARTALLLEALAGKAAAERQRADELADALALAKAELQVLRAQCEGTTDAVREARARDREEVARLRRELSDAREATRSAIAREAELREEMSSTRTHYQEVVDTQTLQLLELTRDLSTCAPVPVRASRSAAATTGTSDDEDAPRFDAVETALAASRL